MDHSDSVEDGEIEEAQTDVKKSVPPENRFATPPVQLQNRDDDDDRAYYRGDSQNIRGADDHRYALERRNDIIRPQDGRYPGYGPHGGSYHPGNRPHVRPPPPPPQFPPRDSAPGHMGGGSGGNRYDRASEGYGVPPVPVSIPPPTHVMHPPHGQGYFVGGVAPPPPPPPTRPFGTFPPQMPFPRPPLAVRPPMHVPVTVPTYQVLPPNTRPPPLMPLKSFPKQNSEDIEMEEVPRPSESSTLHSARPPAINTSYTSANPHGSTTQVTGALRTGYANTPMPSATGTPNYHQYSNSLASARAPSQMLQNDVSRPVKKPLINVVSDPSLTSSSGANSEDRAESSPSPHHRVTIRAAKPIPVYRSQSAPSPSELGASNPTSIAQIMDVISGNGKSIFATRGVGSPRALEPIGNASTPVTQGAYFTTAATTATTPSAPHSSAEPSVTSVDTSNAPGSTRRPRLAWGQGLRRRASEHVDLDSSQQGGEEDGAKCTDCDLDNISEAPSLTFGRAQSEILTPTYMKTAMHSSLVQQGVSGADAVEEERYHIQQVPSHKGGEEKEGEDESEGEKEGDEGDESRPNSDAGNSDNDDMSNDGKDNAEEDEEEMDDNNERLVASGSRDSRDDTATTPSCSKTFVGNEDTMVVEDPSATVGESVKADDTPSRPKGRPGRPALTDEAKALKKAERKAKKKAQAEKDLVAGSRRKLSKGSYDNGDYESGSDWDAEPGSKRAGRRGRPRTVVDSEGEGSEDGEEAPKKKRGRPPAGSVKGTLSITAPPIGSEPVEEAVPTPVTAPASKRGPKSGRKKKVAEAEVGIPALGVPVKRRSRSFGSFERDSLGSIFSAMPDLRNAYYALQGMVRIQVGMRGVDGFDREALQGLAEMLQNPRSVVNLPIPYTSEIMMCLDIIEAQSHQMTEALLKLLIVKNELEAMPVKKSERVKEAKDTTAPVTATAHAGDGVVIPGEGDSLPVKSKAADDCTQPVAAATSIHKDLTFSSSAENVETVTVNRSYAQTPITVMRKVYEKGDQGKRPLSSLIQFPDPQAYVLLKQNIKTAKLANITAHIIPPSFASPEDRAFTAHQVRSNRIDIKRNRVAITEEIRKRKMRRTRAWEILGDRYVSVLHQWQHHLKHTVPAENDDEADSLGPRLRALLREGDEVGSPRIARISALRATSDMCKSEVDQDKILQQMAMIELKQRRLKYGIATIVDMISPWQNADLLIPPTAPTFPARGMVIPDFDYMGSLDQKQDTGGFVKEEEYPACVLESPIIVDLNGSRLTTDGKRQMCAALPDSQKCPPRCNCALQVDRHERQCRPWSDMEKCIFVDKFMQFPKNFIKISAYLVNRTTKDCIKFYYDSKTTIPYKSLLREFDNRKRHLKNSWNHTCAVATSVGGIVYPPEDLEDKEHLYELPPDDISFHSLVSHPCFQASALGFEGSTTEEYGTFRQKQVKYMQQKSPRDATRLLYERRNWKKELSGNGQAAIPRYLGMSGIPGSSRKFCYPLGGIVEDENESATSTGAGHYGGYAQSDEGWMERHRTMNQVRQRKPKEMADAALITSDMLKERKIPEKLPAAVGSVIVTGRGRGRGRRGRRPNGSGRGAGRSGVREVSVIGVSPTGQVGISTGRGRGRGRGRWSSRGGRGRGRGRSSQKTQSLEETRAGENAAEGEAEGVIGGENVSDADGMVEELGGDDNVGDVGGDDEIPFTDGADLGAGGEEGEGEDNEYGEEGEYDGDVAEEEEVGVDVDDDEDEVDDDNNDYGEGEDDIVSDEPIQSDDVHMEGEVEQAAAVAAADLHIEKEDISIADDGDDISVAVKTQSNVETCIDTSEDDTNEAPVGRLPLHISPLTAPMAVPDGLIIASAPTLLQTGTTLNINSESLTGLSLPNVLPPTPSVPVLFDILPDSLPPPSDPIVILPFLPPTSKSNEDENEISSIFVSAKSSGAAVEDIATNEYKNDFDQPANISIATTEGTHSNEPHRNGWLEGKRKISEISGNDDDDDAKSPNSYRSEKKLASGEIYLSIDSVKEDLSNDSK